MFIAFKDINGSDILLREEAIWGITVPFAPPEAPAEILLQGAEKSVKVTRETAVEVKARFA